MTLAMLSINPMLIDIYLKSKVDSGNLTCQYVVTCKMTATLVEKKVEEEA